jgi:uncharacterized protein (TIGR02284 family)
MKPGNIVQILDELAKQARDDEAAYRTAAEYANDLTLTAYSVSCAVVCSERADELEDISILYRTGRKPFRQYFFTPLARTWAWLATCWRERNDFEIVEACQRREDASFDAYQHALGMRISGNLRMVLQYHMGAIGRRQMGFRHLRHNFRHLAHKGVPITTEDFRASGT